MVVFNDSDKIPRVFMLIKLVLKPDMAIVPVKFPGLSLC